MRNRAFWLWPVMLVWLALSAGCQGQAAPATPDEGPAPTTPPTAIAAPTAAPPAPAASPTPEATATAAAEPFPHPQPLPPDADLPWAPPLPELRGATDDPAALQAALVAPNYRPMSMWIGQWPDAWAQVAIPWPEGAWFVLATEDRWPEGTSWRVYLEVPHTSADAWMDAYRARLEALGWRAVKGYGPEGGFMGGGALWVPWCHPEVPWTLALDTLAVGEDHVLVNLALDTMPGGCAGLEAQMGAGPSSGMELPRLTPPSGVRLQHTGSSGSSFMTSQSASLQTDLPVADLDARFAAQVEEQGWEPVYHAAWTVPLDDGQAEGALRMWRTTDDEGRAWDAVLLLLREAPDEPIQALLMAYRIEHLDEQAALNDGRLPEVHLAQPDPALLRRALAVLLAFETRWSLPDAPAGDQEPWTVWVAAAPESFPPTLPDLEPERWLRVVERQSLWEALAAWPAPREQVLDDLTARLQAAGWLAEMPPAPLSTVGFVGSRGLQDFFGRAFCPPGEDGTLWITLYTDPNDSDRTLAALSWQRDPMTSCRVPARMPGMPEEPFQDRTPTLQLPDEVIVVPGFVGAWGDPQTMTFDAAWTSTRDLTVEVQDLSAQMQEQGWEAVGGSTQQRAHWSLWRTRDDQGREWTAHLLVLVLNDRWHYGLMAVRSPLGGWMP